MSAAAELGPIDVQIEHPDREHFTVSALEVAFSYDYLARFATNFISQHAGPRLVESTKLPRIDILRELCGFTAKFLEPAVSKLDPTVVHRASKQLKIAKDYAVTMLRQSKSAQKHLKPEEYIRNLVDHLTHDYSEHGFVVSRGEARSLGLPINPLESHPRWPQMRKLFREYENNIDKEPAMILCLPDKQIDLIIPREEDESNGKND